MVERDDHGRTLNPWPEGSPPHRHWDAGYQAAIADTVQKLMRRYGGRNDARGDR